MSDKVEGLDEIYIHIQSPEEAHHAREILILASRRYPDSIAVKRWRYVLEFDLEFELTKRGML